MHVHVQSSHGEAKFWLEPRIELARSYGLPQSEANDALQLIGENEDVIRRAGNIEWDNNLKRLLNQGMITEDTFFNARMNKNDDEI